MFMTLCEHIAGKEFIMADEKTVINVDLNMFGQDADAKTAAANEVAKSLGISDEASLRWRNSRQPSPRITLGTCRSWAT